jgi:hypothetical protein
MANPMIPARMNPAPTNVVLFMFGHFNLAPRWRLVVFVSSLVSRPQAQLQRTRPLSHQSRAAGQTLESRIAYDNSHAVRMTLSRSSALHLAVQPQ